MGGLLEGGGLFERGKLKRGFTELNRDRQTVIYGILVKKISENVPHRDQSPEGVDIS